MNDMDRTRNFIDYLADTFVHFGDKEAIRHGEKIITYTDLDYQSLILANRLLPMVGGGDDDMVPIIGSRSIDFTLAALAIWKLGRAYLPIDKSTPVARIDEIIARAGYRVAIRTAPDVCQPTNLRNLLDTYECDLESSGNGSHFDRRAVDQAREGLIKTR